MPKRENVVKDESLTQSFKEGFDEGRPGVVNDFRYVVSLFRRGGAKMTSKTFTGEGGLVDALQYTGTMIGGQSGMQAVITCWSNSAEAKKLESSTPEVDESGDIEDAEIVEDESG